MRVWTYNSYEKVDSRIIIDTYAWNRFNPDSQVSLSVLSKSAIYPKIRDQISECYDPEEVEDESDVGYDDDGYSDDEDSYGNCTRPGQTRSSDVVSTLTNEHLLFCKSSLRGYSLKNKKWRMLLLDSVAFSRTQSNQ